MLLDYSMIFQELAPKELKKLGDVAEVELLCLCEQVFST